MSSEFSAAQVDAAKEITIACLNKGVVFFSEEDHRSPEKLAQKMGTLYAGIYEAVINYDKQLKAK